MEKKFQPLNLEKFDSTAFANIAKVLGGLGSSVPDGGSTCPTEGGSTNHYSYTSDTQVYDANGSLYQSDHHGAVWHESA
ncbi:MAG: hypothetical protein KDC66_14140 [Phaeodactylibacter sp.]|nr:hypothetical protein [Phaeodactylibacter sp.]MCB9275538.1 hypothetical protein [Lewinellaceae bacterium]